ncbi:hypothetical protein TNIN_343761 [Trichonephila inaurata madagascariensis]|uniref:Integrase catalytic domain-containing protein n=1 Tax=Trichonephila inaurata madagascariensis TaxID=2747483 RepID=A0A8X6WNC6_9ARAC|nr:hypothetical protein TNIN_343761 [Trichonephila inaurata madagascariensis]
MSFLLKGKKEDFLELATELRLEATVGMTKPMLKNLITKSAGTKSALTSNAFNDYCADEEIQHLQIATGVLRGNGQVERVHRTLIPVLKSYHLICH